MKKKLFFMLLVFTLVLSMLMPDVSANAIMINKKKATMEVDSTLVLKTKGEGIFGKVTWSSSNKKVAKVSSKGKVTAKKEGTAIIKATDESGRFFSCQVVVVDSNKINTPTPTPTPKPTATPTPKPTPTPKLKSGIDLDVSSFSKTDGFWFASYSNFLHTGDTYYSTIYFDEIDWDFEEFTYSDNRITINYKAHSVANYDYSIPPKVSYTFKYTIYDSEGYTIETSDFAFPDMFIGGKAKGTIQIYCNEIEYGESYSISITSNDSYTR